MSQKEVELKLELPPASLPSIKQVPLLKALKPSPSRTAEISVYFDTDKYKLRKNGLMLRVRRIGHRRVQTIKASSSLGQFERAEWENQIAGNEPDLSLAKDSPLGRLASDKLRRQLKPTNKSCRVGDLYSSEGSLVLPLPGHRFRWRHCRLSAVGVTRCPGGPTPIPPGA